MKKSILIMGLVAMGVVSSFAQGNITFKTSDTKNTVFYSPDGTTATLTPVATDGTAGSFGSVSYELLSAPTGTAGLTQAELASIAGGGAAPSGWTESPITGVTISSTPGVVNPVTVTTPASSGAGGSSALVEIFAYTGSLANPSAFGYSGSTFNNGTVTYDWTTPALGNLTTSTGALGWTQATAVTTGSPPPTPATMTAGAAGLGSIVLVSTPEPGTIALCGLGAASLLLFRRRK